MGDQVDLVIMMLVLYYIQPNERKELYKKIRDQWLAPGGRVVVANMSRTKCPGNIMELFVRLRAPFLDWAEIEAELLEAGFTKEYADEIQCERRFASMEEEQFLLHIIQHLAEKPVTPEDVRGVIEELFPEGKTDQMFFTLGVFQKAEWA